MASIGQVKVSGIIAAAPIGLTSDAAIGVDRTYDPEGFSLPGVARWVDRSGGIQVGYPAFTLSVRRPTKGSRVFKVTAKLVLPTLETISASTATGIAPAPTKAYDHTCVIEFMLPERGALAERTVLLNNVISLFMSTINASDGSPTDATGSPLRAAVLNFDPPY